MTDNKQQLGAPLLGGGQAGQPYTGQPVGGADVSLPVRAGENDGQDYRQLQPSSADPDAPKPYNVIASVSFISLVILALAIAALDSTWYIGRLNTTPGSTCTVNCVTQAQTYELSIGMVRLTTTSQASYKDYEQLVIPRTGSVMSAIRAATIVVLVSALLLFLMTLLAYIDDARRSLTSSDFGCYLYQHLPRVLAVLTLLFAVFAILLPLAFTHTFPADDIMRQTTGGTITCQSGQVNCGTFWASQTNTIGTSDVTDMHRPTDSWWIMIVLFLFSVALLYRAWKYNDIVSLRSDREAHERAERNKRRV